MKKTGKALLSVILVLALVFSCFWGYIPGLTTDAHAETIGSDLSEPLTFELADGESTGILTVYNPLGLTMKYSIDKGEKTIVGGDAGTIVIPMESGKTVQLYGDKKNNQSYAEIIENISYTTSVNCDADYVAYGNIMSLVDEEGYETNVTLEKEYAFYGLFEDSTTLKNHPSKKLILPAINLTAECYSYMFYGCTSLSEAPELPAIGLAQSCYFRMFSDCTSMIEAPELRATRLATNCYSFMFAGCSNLSKVTMLAEDISADWCLNNWLEDVSTTGTLTITKQASVTMNENSISGIPTGWTVKTVGVQKPAVNAFMYTGQAQKLVTEAKVFNGSDYIAAENTKYSLDNTNWTTEVPTATEAGEYTVYYKIPSGEYYPEVVGEVNVRIYKNINECPLTFELAEGVAEGTLNIYNPFGLTMKYSINNGEKIVVGGETGTIKIPMESGKTVQIYGDEKNNQSYARINNGSISSTNIHCDADYVVYGNIMSLLDENGYATNVTLEDDYTFNRLFADSTTLKNHPSKELVLPATGLTEECYGGMFRGCTSLSKAPKLPATILAQYCYQSLFYGCTSLNEAPELPATDLVENCYAYMFYGCTSLSEAPELPATNLAQSCYYYMFSDCTNLSEAPGLPAAVLTANCYYSMFSGCTGLNKITMLAEDISADWCLDYWLEDVATTGTLTTTKQASVTMNENSISGIPTGWTVKTVGVQKPAINAFMYTGQAQKLVTEAKVSNGSDYIAAENTKYSLDNTNWSTEVPTATEAGDYTVYYKIPGGEYYPEVSGEVNVRIYKNINECPLTFELAEGEAKGTLNIYNSLGLTMKYSIDNGEKIVVGGETGTIKIPMESGKTVQLYGDEKNNQSYARVNNGSLSHTNIYCDAGYVVYGNIMSLLDENGYATNVTLEDDFTFDRLFADSTTLKNHPSKELVLPAMGLTEECYGEMFSGCTSLSKAPKLPATILAQYCYQGLFYGCTSLNEAPELPATDLAENCYAYMFYGCTSLSEAPELLAINLAKSCYYYMFSDCTNLSEAPGLPATVLTANCYSSMFSGCTGLNKITMLAEDISADWCLDYWLEDVATTGTLTITKQASVTMNENSISGIPTGWTVKTVGVQKPAVNAFMYTGQAQKLVTEAKVSNGSAYITAENTKYSLDNTNWTTEVPTATEAGEYTVYYKIPSGEYYPEVVGEVNVRIYKNINECPLTFELAEGVAEGTLNIYNPFGLTMKYSINNGEKIVVGGETGTIKITMESGKTVQLYGYGKNNKNYSDDGDDSSTRIGCDVNYVVYGNIMSLVDEEGFATNVTLEESNTFKFLFECSETLNNHPDRKLVLPATGLTENCYEGMFYYCVNLTEAPELPAISLAKNCYSCMFAGCIKLNKAPELPATSLAKGCYSSMFADCDSLNKAPELPATSLVEKCYLDMFDGCESLNKAPELPATNLAEFCYSYMFAGCTSLNEAPELPATNLAVECYSAMFLDCDELVEAPKLPATNLAKECYAGMFLGCTELTEAPELPASSLAEKCYYFMFNGCTSLTEAPELPATTLADGCYCFMFAGCTSLNKVTMLAEDISAKDCLKNWLKDVSTSGTLTKLDTVELEENSASGIPEGWTVNKISTDNQSETGDNGNNQNETGNNGNSQSETGDNGNNQSDTGDNGNSQSDTGDNGNNQSETGDNGNSQSETGDNGNNQSDTGDNGNSQSETGDNGNNQSETGNNQSDTGNNGNTQSDIGNNGNTQSDTGNNGNTQSDTGNNGNSQSGTTNNGNTGTQSGTTYSGTASGNNTETGKTGGKTEKTEETSDEKVTMIMENKDGSKTTTKVKNNADGSKTVKEETVDAKGKFVGSTETTVSPETEDSDGTKTVTTKKSAVGADGKTTLRETQVEKVYKPDKNGTEKTVSTTEKSDGKGNTTKETITVKSYIPDANGNKKTVTDTKTTDTNGNKTVIKETVITAASDTKKVTRVTQNPDGTKTTISFTISNKKVKLTGLTTTEEILIVPDFVVFDGVKYPVKSISKGFLKKITRKTNAALKAIVFDKKITKIGKGALKEYKSIEDIVLTSSVKKIGKHAFYNMGDVTFYIKADTDAFNRIVNLLKKSGFSKKQKVDFVQINDIDEYLNSKQ